MELATIGRGLAARRCTGVPHLKGPDTNRLFVYRKEGAMGKLMKQAEKFAKSPKAKDLEKKMLRKAKDPETRAKISKRFGKLRKKA